MSLDRSNGQGGRGDQAFRDADGRGTWQEMTYGGAVSFARRRYSRTLPAPTSSSAASPMTTP